MRRFSISCGDLKAVCMADTAYSAAIAAVDFCKDGQTLGHRFYVKELVVEDGKVKARKGTISYGFDDIMKAKGWFVESD